MDAYPLVGRDCDWCGAWMEYSGRGRPRRYCSKSCRNRGSEVRRRPTEPTAPTGPGLTEEQTRQMAVLTGDLLRPPVTARDWAALLDDLADDLAAGPLRTKHFDHRHLYAGLVRALTALDEAHPGGLDSLARR
ncbi:hypothetical protein [Thermomonospora umbrina]|uniref:hypothetical protein n=1 Tax=Thermomonospora umbrina TaxID=111806 RepID=UPI0011C19538|nr:hypothetical protein [Thermomonospora umbrina]